jgi:hypothetical protein
VVLRIMSALPPKADMCSALAYVCFGSLTAALANDGRGCFTPISGRRSASGKGLIETMLIVLTNEENDYANRANLVGGADPTLRG